MNYRSFLFGSACAVALCAGHVHAAQNDPVTEFDSVSAFRTWATTTATTTQLQNLTSFHLAAYYCATPSDRTGAACPADGGEGLFVQKNNAAGSCTASDDGGSNLRVTKSLVNYCFRRANLNGDLRQFGVTVGSVYDCSPTTGSGVSGCTDSSAPVAALVAAITSQGLHSMSTSGVQIKTSADLEVPSGVSLNLGGIAPMGHRTTGTGLLDIPGTVFLATGKSVKLDEHSGIRNGIILPDWYTLPADIHDLYALRDGMVSHGDTGLVCTASGCVIDDMEVDGFDTAIDIDHSTFTNLHNVIADGNVCYYLHGGGANEKFETTGCFPNFSYATAPGSQTFSREFFGVTAVAESPATPGICRVTLAKRTGTGAPDVDDIENDFITWGTGADSGSGGVNINDRYKATLISATSSSGTFDLQGSKCDDDGAGYLNGSTVTATWAAGDTKLYVSDTSQVHVNQVIRGVTGIPTDSKVIGIWRNKMIVIDQPASLAGSAVSVTLKSPSFSGRTVDCDGLGNGICLVLDGIARVDAGASTGGTDAGGAGHATGYMIGGPDSDDEVSSFTASMPQTLAHQIAYHVQNSNEVRMYAPLHDTNGDYEDPNTVFAWIDGDTSNSMFVGGVGGKVGTGIRLDMVNSKACFSYIGGNAQTINHSFTQLELNSGCFLANGMRPGSGNAFVANDVEHVDLTRSYLPGVDIFYEGPEAQGKTSTLAAEVTTGANNLINLNVDVSGGLPNTAPLPPLDTALQVVQADGLDTRIVQDAFGATAVISGRRADGTLLSPSHVLAGDELAEFGGIGYTGANGYTSENKGGVSVEACDDWAANNTCAATTLRATEKSQVTVREVARAEAAGIGINSGAGVAAQLEVVSTSPSTTLTNALNSSSTSAITVGSTTGFPSPGTMLIDGEAISYRVTGPTTINPLVRGVWGTTAAAHSAGATIAYFSEFKGNPSSPRLDFATDSLGDMWWRGHLLSGGTTPGLSGAGTSASIVGNDSAGRITAGTASLAATFTLTFAQPWPNAPVCFAQDETNTAKNPIAATTVSTTAVTFTAAATLGASNKVSYACTGFR